MTDNTDTEFSLLLWMLGALVAGLAVHVAQGWARHVQLAPRWHTQWLGMLLGALALGGGLSAAFVLGMQAQALPFAVGYGAFTAAGLMMAAVVASVPLLLLPRRSIRLPAMLGAGAWLAAVAVALHWGWVQAAGFRPGVEWRRDLVAAAFVMWTLALGLAWWVAYSEATQASGRRTLWRMSAVVLAALALMGGEELMTSAAGLGSQKGSLHQDGASGLLLGLACGVVVPMLLAGMAIDLWLRRTLRRRRSHGEFNPQQRRKRRHRVRTL